MANSRGRKLYRVTLSAQERRDLKAIVDGTGAAWRRRRAQVLMLADEGALGLSMPTLRKGWASATVERLRKRCGGWTPPSAARSR